MQRTKHRTHRIVVSAAMVVVFASVSPHWASAKPKPGKTIPTASASTPIGPPALGETLAGQAKADYEAAKLLYGDGDFAGALVKFKSAYDESHDARLLWNMGACEKNLRHYARVLSLVRRYLSEGGALVTDQERQESNNLITTIEAFTAAARFVVDQDGAEVFIDDELVGTTPLKDPIIVDIGMRKIRVRKPGFIDYQQPIPVGGAKDVAITVQLVKEVHEGKLTVRANPHAVILLDGKQVGHGTWSGPVPSGGHTLRVVAEGMIPYQSEVVIQDNENRSVDVPLARIPQPVIVAKPEEETGPFHGMELGLRSGYGRVYQMGDAKSIGGASFVPIWFDIGYRVGRPTFLGLFVSYAGYDKSGTCGINRHGPTAQSPTDMQVRYAYWQCWHSSAGISLLFHTLPRMKVDPWFGFDSAFQMSMRRYRSFNPLTNQYATEEQEDGGPSFMAGFQLGIDVRLVRGLGFGPFARVAVVGGDDLKRKDDNNSVSTSSNFMYCPSGARCGTQDSGGNGGVWPQLIFGLRVAHTF